MEDSERRSVAGPGILESLEVSLTCGICKGAFNTPMMLKDCMHVYCSLCIRRWRQESDKCPSCGSVTRSASSLVNMRPLVPILELRKDLTVQLISADMIVDRKPCPFCGASQLELSEIKAHVKSCYDKKTAERSRSENQVDQTERPAAVPTVWFKGKSDKQVRNLLAEHGLNPVGSRAALEDKFREYVLRKSAAADKFHQVARCPSDAQIREEVEHLDRLKRGGGPPKPQGPLSSFLPAKSRHVQEVELEAGAAGFARLLEQASASLSSSSSRKRKLAEAEPVVDARPGDPAALRPTTPGDKRVYSIVQQTEPPLSQGTLERIQKSREEAILRQKQRAEQKLPKE